MSSPPRQRRRLNDEESEDDDDGNMSDPPPEDARPDLEINEDPDEQEEEGEGDDLDENVDADYQAIPQLDSYDVSMLDHREYGSMDYEARRRAEETLADRDQMDTRDRGRLAGILDEYASEDEEERERRRARFSRRDAERQADREEEGQDQAGQESDLEDGGEDFNLEAFNVPLREWIAEDRTRREIKKRFQRFLLTFQDHSNKPKHDEKIRNMCAANLASLEISYSDLTRAAPILAIWLADAPKDMLDIMNEVANRVVLRLFPEYGKIHDEIHTRITSVPILDKLRDLREVHLGALIKVHGVVTRRSGVFPQLKLVKYTCVSCRAVLGPYRQGNTKGEVKPHACPRCQSEGPFHFNQEQTVYRNYQKITLQESPGSVLPGRVPRYKEVILLADLIDKARPGEEIEVTGVYSHNYESRLLEKAGFPVFSTMIEANFLQKREDLLSIYALTDEDKKDIQDMARDPQIGRRIVSSIAPSIYGHQHVKTAIALSLFGGCAKNVNNKHRIRGDVNVLLLGDPGTAKSQVLKYCEKTAPRAVYTTGKGASAVGLTAGVHKDPMTREWTLEGGALVLADKGMCLIDEFDKMSEQDRTSIHEAMEQQSISVSKAGIVTSLQARCAVVAAANPIGGRYDASMTLAENVELTDPILQRFDCLCVLQDTVDPVLDEQLAKFVVGSHRRSTATSGGANEDDDFSREDNAAGGVHNGATALLPGQKDLIPQPLLRKYIMYARHHVRPQLHSIDLDKVARLYADLRRESVSSGGVPIAVRHIESIMRMAEAHARMHLRDHVRDDDVDAAIATTLQSFIEAQKFSVRRALQRGFRKYLTLSADYHELLMHELQRLVRNAQTYERLRKRDAIESLEVQCDDLEAKAREYNVYDLSGFYKSTVFLSHDFSVDRAKGVIVKRFV